MRIACVQTDVDFNDPAGNAAKAIRELERLKSQDVDLAVFPEAFLAGYCVDGQQDAINIALAVEPHKPGTPLGDIGQACDKLGMHAVVGFAEWQAPATEDGEPTVFNSAALFEPGKGFRLYRKSHLPFLGLDRFVDLGRELPVFDTALGRIGILICFDLRIPEASRVLALQGAELIVLPTNWPEGAEVSAEHVSIARAAENMVFMATCNRVGSENGFNFIGKSKVIAPGGTVLAAAGTGEETIIADIDLADARVKRRVVIPGKYETDVIGARHPELYGAITDQGS